MNTKPKTQGSKKALKIKKQDIYSIRGDTQDIFASFPKKIELLDYFKDFNLDTFSDISISDRKEQIFKTKYSEFKDSTIELTQRARKYQYKIIFYFKGVSCIEYHEGTMLSANIITRNLVTITGKAWRVLGQEKIIRIFEKYFIFEGFKQMDVAVDLLLPMDHILLQVKKLSQAGRNDFGNQGQVETKYIGKYGKSDNRYKLIRFYNKILEIKVNKTQHLYPDYLAQKHITRIEIEFRIELCKNITWEQFKDINYLFNLFCTHISKHTKIFSKIQTEKISLIRSKKSIGLENLSPEEILQSTTLKMFKGLSRSLQKVKVCPVRYLINSGIYDIDTLRDIFISFDDNDEFDHEFFENGTTI